MDVTANHLETYIFYPCHETLHGCFGKWMIFCYKHCVNELWTKLHPVVDALRTNGSVVCMKVSTSRPNPHSSSTNTSVIMIYTPMQQPEEHMRDIILNVGRYLVRVFNDRQGFCAPAPFSPNNRIYYKTQEQSRAGTRMTGTKHNTLTSFVLPNHCVYCPEMVNPIASMSNYHHQKQQQSQKQRSMAKFVMTPAQLHAMGAVWNPELDQWFAPNEKVAAQMQHAALLDASCALPSWRDSLSVMSINLWGNLDSFAQPELALLSSNRMRHIVSSIETHQPDIVCMQEVTDSLLAILHPLLEVQGYLACSNPHSNQTIVYIHIVSLTFHYVYQEEEFKHCQLLQLTHKTTQIDFMLCNVHFPAGPANSALRILCLQQALMRLELGRQPFVLIGDTNFCFEQDVDVEATLPAYVQDAWVASGSSMDHRATYDHAKNTHLQCKDRRKVGSRFDRALVDSRTFQTSKFQLVCTDLIQDHNIHASDHFGILIQLTL